LGDDVRLYADVLWRHDRKHRASPLCDATSTMGIKAAGALIGLVMKETKGQAYAAKVRDLMLAHLSKS
jgi:hypothetical protein